MEETEESKKKYLISLKVQRIAMVAIDLIGILLFIVLPAEYFLISSLGLITFLICIQMFNNLFGGKRFLEVAPEEHVSNKILIYMILAITLTIGWISLMIMSIMSNIM